MKLEHLFSNFLTKRTIKNSFIFLTRVKRNLKKIGMREQRKGSA